MYILNYCCIPSIFHTFREKPKALSKEPQSQSEGVPNS